MRPLSFDPQTLRKHLLRHKIATLPELKSALGTNADLTIFRKLKLLDYLSSYTHRGRYYALRETARFDDAGLWSHDAVWFSRHGTLVSTIESFVNHSPRGWFADELADRLYAEVQDPSSIWYAPNVCAAPKWLADSSTPPPIAGKLGISSAPGKPPSRFLWWPMLPRSRYLPMNSKRLFCSSIACWMSSSVVCSPGWSPSNWDTEAIAFWPDSSAWIRTLSPVDASNCSIRMYRLTARAVPAADAN
jgi:hypothetical protein